MEHRTRKMKENSKKDGAAITKKEKAEQKERDIKGEYVRKKK